MTASFPSGVAEQLDRMGREGWIAEVRSTLRALEKAELQMRMEEDLILRRQVPLEFLSRKSEFIEREAKESALRQPTETELQSAAILRHRIWHFVVSRKRLVDAAIEMGFTLGETE